MKHFLQTLLSSGLGILVACSGGQGGALAKDAELSVLVDPAWVQDQSGENLIVFDARPMAAYNEGHVPGAINFDCESTWRAGPPESLMKRVTNMAVVLSGRGVDSTKRIVVYDDGVYKDAARLFWVLETHGVRSLAVLEGGLQRWLLEGRPLELEPNEPLPTAEFMPALSPDAYASTTEVYQAIDSPNVLIVDARPHDHWRGETSKTSRMGRIPSATHRMWCEFLEIMVSEGERSSARWSASGAVDAPWCSSPELRAGQWAAVARIDDLEAILGPQPTEPSEIIVYCNRGKQSAVAYLALRNAGLQVSAYDGSWIEWCKQSDLPIDDRKLAAAPGTK